VIHPYFSRGVLFCLVVSFCPSSGFTDNHEIGRVSGSDMTSLWGAIKVACTSKM